MSKLVKAGCVVAFLAVTFFLRAAEDSTDRKGEEARLVELARYLERAPLATDAPELRSWALAWLIDHPDLDFKVCTAFLQPLLESGRKYMAEINLQMAISSGAFIIEHPEKRHDQDAVYLAGLEGSVKVYEAIATSDPKAKWRFMERLVKKLYKGELPAYIEGEKAMCD